MAERSSITQLVNWGVEGTATPGTPVVGNKQMSALDVEVGPSINFDTFRPAGHKYSTIVSVGKDWAAARLTGKTTYTEIVYPMSSLLGAATIATPSGGTASRSWTFNPATTSADLPSTFTVECGSSVRASKFSYGLVTGLTIPFDRDTMGLSGDMIGQFLTDGITMTGTAAAIALVPILPKQLTVSMDGTSGSLGSTTLGRVLSGEWSLTGRYAPLWVVNAANTSWVTHVEVEPTATFKLLVEADAEGGTILTAARAGTTKFLRLRGVGDVIEAGSINYRLTMDVAGKVENVTPYQDKDGVYAQEFTFRMCHDASWGKALTVEVINSLTAL
jgi:hypothetical protein